MVPPSPNHPTCRNSHPHLASPLKGEGHESALFHTNDREYSPPQFRPIRHRLLALFYPCPPWLPPPAEGIRWKGLDLTRLICSFSVHETTTLHTRVFRPVPGGLAGWRFLSGDDGIPTDGFG